jgi:hypothetical protein
VAEMDTKRVTAVDRIILRRIYGMVVVAEMDMKRLNRI